MFGFGRKQDESRLTAAHVAAFNEVSKKYSTVVPGCGMKVWELSGSIGNKIIGTFNEKTFDILIKQHHIDKDFNPGWSYHDSLSRWYALGVICLTRCLMTKPWNDALPRPFDLEVYDASLELMWILWMMPDPVKAKADSFIRENFLEIKKSFGSIVDAETNAAWFRRYGDRMIGANPPWEIRNDRTPGELETLLQGERTLADVFIGQLISRAFMATGEAVLSLLASPRSL